MYQAPAHCTDCTCVHWPSMASFQRVTWLLASDTARILPVTDQLTRHTGAPKLCSCTLVHAAPASAWVQICTVPSCDALAIVFLGRPMLGAQAASRTQSECAESVCSSAHSPPTACCTQTLSVLSHPALTSRRTGAAPCATPTSAPADAAGDQLTARAPSVCAPDSFLESHSPVWSLYASTATLPSDDALASISPSSCGAQHTLLTELSCSVAGLTYTCVQLRPCEPSASRHTITLWSYPQVANRLPNLGCAHATCHTGPSWPLRSARCDCEGASGEPETENTFTVRSLLHVARRVP
mmetsp:Transcript_10587/g.43767  ORF Transcript_10587/g.43767 Transcript_10587/m.43767 type:complete len:297 (-) Transcript_10587:421-1311(-)